VEDFPPGDTTEATPATADDASSPDEIPSNLVKFAGLLEQRMLEGHTEASNRTWATLDLGVPLKQFEDVQRIILKAWRLDGVPADVTRDQRDVIRQRFNHVYRVAIKAGKIKEALAALNALVKLDALDQPIEGSLEQKIVGGVITNAARETLGALMKKARELAERGVPKPELPPGGVAKVVDIDVAVRELHDGASEEMLMIGPTGQVVNGNGHSNGGSKSMVIDLREKK